MRPARVVGHRAVEVRAAAVRIEQRKAGAHAGAGVLLVFEAGHEPRGGRQGRADHGVQALPALAEVTDVAIAVRLHGHDAAMHAAFAVQRQGQIGLGAAKVPAAQRQRGMAARRLARLLAHEVHRGRRIARAIEQARGAAHDLHAVVEGRVHVGGAEVPQAVDGRGQAVELEVADAKAARGKLVAVAVAAADRQAGGGGLQRLRDRELACIVHELARDHADRLRSFARRQLQARGRSRGAAGVARRAFGGARIGGGTHGDGAQFGIAFPGRGPVLVGGPDCWRRGCTKGADQQGQRGPRALGVSRGGVLNANAHHFHGPGREPGLWEMCAAAACSRRRQSYGLRRRLPWLGAWAEALAKGRGEIAGVLKAHAVGRFLHAPALRQPFARQLHAALAQPAEHGLAVGGLEFLAQRGRAHAGQARQVVQAVRLARRCIHALAHALQAAPVPGMDARRGRRPRLRMCLQRAGQHLQRNAFAVQPGPGCRSRRHRAAGAARRPDARAATRHAAAGRTAAGHGAAARPVRHRRRLRAPQWTG